MEDIFAGSVEDIRNCRNLLMKVAEQFQPGIFLIASATATGTVIGNYADNPATMETLRDFHLKYVDEAASITLAAVLRAGSAGHA